MRQLHILLLALLGLLVTATPLDSRGYQENSVSIAVVKREDGLIYDLEKRKGGGGGGKGGSSSGGGGKTGSSSSSGGRSGGGSGVRPAYGGGSYYGGGAAVPFKAGGKTPRGLLPIGLLPIAALAFFPGIWLYGAYLYPYSRPYSYRNATSGLNETKPVKCLCEEFSECGCDDNDDPQYLRDIIGNGSTEALNSTLVRVATVNDTSTIFINGTLPNGTIADDEASIGSLTMSPIKLSSPAVWVWAVMTLAMVLAL